MPKELEHVDLSEFSLERQPCKIGRFDLSADQRAKVNAAMMKPEPLLANARIASTLNKWGFSVTAATVITHRRGECGCTE